MKRTFLLSLLLLLPALAAAAEPVASPRAQEQAEALYQRALEWLARNTVDTRRQALRALEQATLLEPGNAVYELTLARAYYASGFLKSARQRFERVTRIEPGDAAGHQGLGLVWRRDWLKYLDRRSLDRAVEQLSRAAQLDPGRPDAWLLLVPLLVEQGDSRAASAAALRALESDPRRLEACLAVAHTSYLSGRLREADSLYAATIPLLGTSLRARFEDISPVATEQDTATLHHLPRGQQAGFVERFWKENDPDLATPENEARLEYWSRVTQAHFLFFNAKRGEWDERGEVYVRYGPPAEMRYNPVAERLSWAFATGPAYPANLLVWNYPELGMDVMLQDRLLSEHYLLPISRTQDMDPTPDPDSLAKCTNALATRGGRGVFHLLPPGARPLPVRGVVARFEGGRGPHLLAQLEAPGGPVDSLWVEWVVLDSARTERGRASALLSPSACAATTRRVADFAADLAPGSYIVSATVHDGDGRRGILREPVELQAPHATLALSDVVVACGTPDVGAGPVVRIEPNPAAWVAGAGPLTAYFEIYHLKPGSDGLGRFEYVYTVRSTAKDNRFWLQKFFWPNPMPSISVSRQEQHLGDVRRQFVTVPVASLPAGRYRLEIKVRDLVTEDEVVRQAEFLKTD